MTTRMAKIIVITVTVCVAALLGINPAVAWYVRRYDAQVEPPLALVSRLAVAQAQAADAELRSHRPSADLLSALRTPKDFKVGHRVSDIPAPVRAAFAKADHENEFLMAEPGANWDAGCVRRRGVPHQRLTAVAVNKSFCLVFYEDGGIARTDAVTAFRFFGSGATPIWHTYPGVAELAGLFATMNASTKY